MPRKLAPKVTDKKPGPAALALARKNSRKMEDLEEKIEIIAREIKRQSERRN